MQTYVLQLNGFALSKAKNLRFMRGEVQPEYIFYLKKVLRKRQHFT